MRKIKVNARKHVMLGNTNEDGQEGFLFVIRHLVPKEEEMPGFKLIYQRDHINVWDCVFHVSEETFYAMIELFRFNKWKKLQENNDV